MNPPRVGIVMEFCSKGEFGEFIKSYREEEGLGYPMEEKFRILREVCSAMAYLHSRNIIHRDIKCENVLIDEMEHAKLMDFGLSRLVDRMSVQKTKRIGTGIYMAPEVINDAGNYSEKCDMFSMAIMMYIVVSENFHPYGGNEYQIEFRVSSNPYCRPEKEKLLEILENEEDKKWIIDAIECCWNHDPQKRYSFEHLGVLFRENGVGIERKSGKKSVVQKETKREEDFGSEVGDEPLIQLVEIKQKYNNAMKKLDLANEEIVKLKKEIRIMKEIDEF